MYSQCTASADAATTTNTPHKQRVIAAVCPPAAEVRCPSGLRSSVFDVDVIFAAHFARSTTPSVNDVGDC